MRVSESAVRVGEAVAECRRGVFRVGLFWAQEAACAPGPQGRGHCALLSHSRSAQFPSQVPPGIVTVLAGTPPWKPNLFLRLQPAPSPRPGLALLLPEPGKELLGTFPGPSHSYPSPLWVSTLLSFLSFFSFCFSSSSIISLPLLFSPLPSCSAKHKPLSIWGVDYKMETPIS